MSCPNITSPEWESLVSAIGVENAWREFFKYGEIPNVSMYDVEKTEGKKVLYSIKTKTTAELAKGINKDLIKSQKEIKYTSFIQALVLNKIGDITPNKVLKVTPAEAFASAKSNFETSLKNVNNFIGFIKTAEKFNTLKEKDPIRFNKILAGYWLQNISSFEEAVEAGANYKEIVDNFKKYETYVIADLLSKGLKISKNKNKIDAIDPQDKEDQNQDDTEDNSLPNIEINPQKFDATIFEVNPYDTATVRVRALIQTIKTGQYEMGIPLYADPSDVMDDMLYAGVSMNLSGFTDKDSKFEKFKQALQEREEGRPYIKELLAKIEKAEEKGDWAIINQILTFASKAFANEELLLYTLRKTGSKINSVTGVKIIGGNRDTIIDQIKRDWISKQQTSNFYNKAANGDLTPKLEKVEELNKIREEGKLATGDAQKKKFIEYFKVLGIEFTMDDLKVIAPKVNKLFRKNFSILFDKNNLLDNIYNSFKNNLNVPFEGQYGFQDEGREMGFLAQLYFDATPNIYKAGSTKTADGKTKYLYIQTNNAEISKREFQNTDGTSVTNTALAQPNSGQNGFWRKVKQNTAKFILGYFNGSREQEAGKEGKVRKNFTEKEQIVNMLLGHQANMKEGSYITFTLSDKTTSMQTKMTKEFFVDDIKIPVGSDGNDYSITKSGEIKYTNDFKDRVYNSFVEPEISRILSSMKYESSVNLKNFNIASKLFYFFPKLNEDVSLENFRKDLYSGKFTIEELNAKYSKIVADVVINEFILSTENSIDKFIENGIIEVNKKGKYEFALYDTLYVNRFKEVKTTDKNLAMLMSMDMKLNYMNSQIKTIQFLKFDPMHAFKAFAGFKGGDFDSISNEDKIKLANSTWDEFSKRAAALIAPGSQGNWTWKYDGNKKTYGAKQTYRTVTLKDIEKGNQFSNKKFETTDAQEFVTMQEHIDYLMSEGRIPLEVWESIHNKIQKEGPGGYYELTKEELGYVLTPMKPVYAGSSKEGPIEAGLNRFDYVKSSRFPLIPQHEAGSERDKLRIWMEKNDIQSANFASGKKLGKPSLSVEVFDENNNFIEPVDFEKGLQELSRDGLRNQQEIPHQKDQIATVSQMNRTLFDGLLESRFDFSGLKNVSGEEMKAVKEAIRAKMFDIAAEKLKQRIGDLHRTNEGLYNMLEEIILEDTTGSYTKNDLRSLTLNDQGMFEIPLEVQFKFPKFQGLINSMINKNVMLKVEGTSFVQVSGVGAKFNFKDLSKGVKSDIVWTDKFAKTFKDGEATLKYISKDKQGNVQPAQVIVSQYLRDEKGELIDLKDFITEKNGVKILDTSRFTPEMLQLVASRIPNQSHVSMLPIEVVGFLPSYMENTIVVPDGITGQMGSDFDVDKLFAYTSKFKYTGKTSKERLGANEEEYNELIESAKKIAKAAGEKEDKKGIFQNFNKYLAQAVKEKYGDAEVPKFKIEKPISITPVTYEINSISDVNNLTEEQLSQAYRDMHWNVLTHEDTFDKITKSVDMDEVKDKVDLREKQLEKYGISIDKGANLPLDYQTSINRFTDNKSGKDGVSIYANLISAQADMQDKPLTLGKINKETNEEEPNPVQIKLTKNGKIINLLYIGKTGESKSFIGEKRSISDNLNIQFTESVDNAKNQFLREFGWNDKSMGAMGMLTMLTDEKGQAVPIEFMMDLSSQPAVKKLLNLIDLKQDAFGTFKPDALKESIVELQEIIEKTIDNKRFLPVGDKAGIYLTDSDRDKVLDPQTLADMWLVGKAIEANLDATELEKLAKDLKYDSVDNMLLKYYAVQYDSLELFQRLNGLGKELMTILGSLYTYTKGIGPNVFVTKQKLNQLNKLADSENFIGIKNLAGVVEKNKETGIINITPEGELGSSIENSLIEAQRIYGYLFPIATGKNLESIVTSLLDGLGENLNTISSNRYETVFNNVFSSSIEYLYTHPDLELFEDVRATRERLINGDNSLGIRITKLKSNPEWAKNGFLKNLQIDPIWNSDIQTISFKAPFGTQIDGDVIENGFYELATYKGENEEEIRSIAKDLMLYVYATGDAGYMGSKIPVDYYMNDKEFARGIRRIGETYSKNISNVEYQNTLLEQIVQNNADDYSKKFYFTSSESTENQFKTLLKPFIGNSENLAKVSKFTISRGDFKSAEGIVNSLTIPLSDNECAAAIAEGLNPYTTDKNKQRVPKAKYPPYILISDTFQSDFDSAGDRNIKYLYKRTSKALNVEGNATYERINILGIKGIKEFDANPENSGLSSIIKNNSTDTMVDPEMYPEEFDMATRVTSGITKVDTGVKWGDIKDATTPYTENGVIVTRIKGTNEQFGNPYIGSKRRNSKGEIVETAINNTTAFGTIAEASQAYKEWIAGKREWPGNSEVSKEDGAIRRQWIIDQIKSGALDNKTLLYYEPQEIEQLNGTIIKGGYFSHADVLADFVNNRDKSKTITQQSGPREYTPDVVTKENLPANGIFVFGSNEGNSKGEAPTHGSGAAKVAKEKFGAIQGQSKGLQGQSYAIVTKKFWDVERSSTLPEIGKEIQNMLLFAKSRPDLKFYVTKIGSEKAGYSIEEIKGLFEKLSKVIPDNVILPIEYEVRDKKQLSTSIESPSKGVELLSDSGLSVEKANEFIDILSPIIAKSAAIENVSGNSNYMFSFGKRWARIISQRGYWKTKFDNEFKNNPEFAKDISDSDGNIKKRMEVLNKYLGSKFNTQINPYNKGWSATGFNYGYDDLDAFGNPVESMNTLAPITKYIESKLGIDLSNYDSVLANIYTEDQMIPPHRDTTEDKNAEGYAIVVLNIGADGSISEIPSDFYSKTGDKSKSRWKDLSVTNGGVYAFGVDGVNRFNFFHAINTDDFGKTTPTKPLTLPDGSQLKNYRITLTYRRVTDPKEDNSPIKPAKKAIIQSTQQPGSVKKIDNVDKPEFNKLPGKSDTPTMTYAGIGSRETPKEVLDKMTEVAKYLDSLGYTLQTGFTFKNKETGEDEEGADKAFSQGSKNKMLFGPSGIRKTVKGNTSLESYDDSVTKTSGEIVKEIHPAPDRLKPGAVKLMARNTNQIFGKNLDSSVDFVLFYAKETDNPLRPKGGTGQAVEMARRKGIPTINMADTNWKQQLKAAIANKATTQPSTSVEEGTLLNQIGDTITQTSKLKYKTVNLNGVIEDITKTEKGYDVTLRFKSYNGSKIEKVIIENGEVVKTIYKNPLKMGEFIESKKSSYDFKFLKYEETIKPTTVKAYRTSDTFSSKVDYAQRGSGSYYALDKPFQEVGRKGEVKEIDVSYNSAKTLDATTEEGQNKFIEIKRSVAEGKTFKSIKEMNDAVSQAMIDNGYESLIGWIEQDDKSAGRELVVYTKKDITDVEETTEPTTVDYKGTSYILEGSEEDGYQVYTTSKGEKSKLVTDENLLDKINLTHAVSLYPERVVTLTNIQHQPSYYVDFAERVISLAPSNYGGQITSGNIYDKVMSVYENKILVPTKDEPVASKPETVKYEPNYIEVNGRKLETFKWDKDKKIAIKLTKDQDKAVRTIVDHYQKNPDVPFILKGKAGTGKTTVIRVINEYFKESSVIITPTHKAGKNASLVTYGNTQNKYKTFASTYGGATPVPNERLLIFDEVSMLNNFDLETFNKKIKPGQKVIFMGDQRQLPPIKANKISAFFNSEDNKNVYELKEVMRFDEQGSIFKIADKFAENLQKYSVIKQYPEKLISDKDAVYSVDSSKRLVDAYMHYYKLEKNDPSKVRLVVYGNKTAELYNNQIRNIIYKGDAEFNVINNNDLLTGNAGWSTKNVLQSPMVNSSEYKVVEEPRIANRTYDGQYNFVGQSITYKEIVSDKFEAERNITIIDPTNVENNSLYNHIATMIVNMKNIYNSNDRYKSKYNEELNRIEKSGIYSLTTMYAKPSVVDPKTKEVLSVDLYTLDQIIAEIKKENPKLSEDDILNMIDNDKVKQYYKIEPNVSFGYAITTHKSQGSTYKHVLVDESNMSFKDNTRRVDDKDDEFYAYEANQMRYVAFSRPTTTLVIYTKKPIGEDLIYEDDKTTPIENDDTGGGIFDLSSFIAENIKQDISETVFGSTGNELTTKDILNNVLKQTTSLNKQLLSLVSKTGGVGNLRIVVDKKIKNPGEYDSSTKVIKINPELAISDNVENDKEGVAQLHEVIMHELLHHITTDLLNTNLALLTVDQRKWVTSLKNLFKTTQEKLLKDSKHSDALKEAIDVVSKENGFLSTSDKSKYYGLTSVDEFVSMLMTDEGFREFMNEITYEGNKSILERFIEILSKILEALGVQVKDNSVLKEGITNIVGLIESRNIIKTSEDSAPLRSISTESAKANLIKENFESIIESLNIKTQC